MIFEEKVQIVNHEVRQLLVVTCDVPSTFGQAITNQRGGQVDTYLVPWGVYREFHENGQHIYWFLPTQKNTVYLQDDTARDAATANAANIDYLAMMADITL